MSNLYDDEQMRFDIERLKATNGVLLDTAKNQEVLICHFRRMLVTVVICFTIVICSMVAGFFYYESQFETVETTTTTTELTTSGENANINNVSDGDMYNDNATHNE